MATRDYNYADGDSTTVYVMVGRDAGAPVPGYVTWVSDIYDSTGIGYANGFPVPVGALVGGSIFAIAKYPTIVGGNNILLPHDIPNLKLDLDSANPRIVLAAGKVQSWPDYSTSAATATQLTVLNQPTYIASHPAFNGYPAVDFDGANSKMTFVSSAISSANTSQTMFMVVDLDSIGGAGIVLLDISLGRLAFYIVSGQLVLYNGSTYTVVGVFGLGPHILTWRLDSGNSLMDGWVGGIAGTQVAYGNAKPLGGNEYLGYNGGGGQFFDGRMARVLLYDRALSTLEINSVHAFLQKRYNI